MKELIERECPVCSKIYQADPGRLKYDRQTTCSRECSYELRAQAKTKDTTLICPVCNKEFKRNPSQLKSKHGHSFCSSECHYKGRTLGLSQHPVGHPYKLKNPNRISALLKPITNRRPALPKLPTLPKPVKEKVEPYLPTINPKFGHWIAGMIDGDGCFQMTKNSSHYSCSFNLMQRNDNSAILQEIIKETKIGYPQYLPKYKTSNPLFGWCIGSKNECLSLIHILDQYPLRAKKLQDYLIWKEAVLLLTPGDNSTWEKIAILRDKLTEARRYKVSNLYQPAPVSTNDESFGHWLAGFIAAEGCFRVVKVRKGNYYSCRFSLKLREDDSKILETIISYTGIGKLCAEKIRTGNSKSCSIWSVHTMSDCQRLVSFLTTYPLRSKKNDDFSIWKEAVSHWISIAGRDVQRDWSKMIEFKKAIEDARKYNHQ